MKEAAPVCCPGLAEKLTSIKCQACVATVTLKVMWWLDCVMVGTKIMESIGEVDANNTFSEILPLEPPGDKNKNVGIRLQQKGSI